jgi:hypothetical protein
VFPSAAKVMRRGSTWQFHQPIAYQKSRDIIHKRVNGMSACDLRGSTSSRDPFGTHQAGRHMAVGWEVFALFFAGRRGAWHHWLSAPGSGMVNLAKALVENFRDVMTA